MIGRPQISFLIIATASLCGCRPKNRQVPSEFATITSTSVYVAFDSSGRSTEPFLVYYELARPFAEATLEFLIRDSISARYPLSQLSVGKHLFKVPPGMTQAFDPPTFSCSLGNAPILTYFVESLRNHEVAAGDSVTLYDYKPDPTPENSLIRLDAASPYRGKEIGVSGFNIPYPRNEELKRQGKPPEIELIGVNLVNGMEVNCSKGDPAVLQGKSVLRDVKVVSTVSHEDNDDIPVLQAARFSMPENVIEPVNTLRIVGIVEQR